MSDDTSSSVNPPSPGASHPRRASFSPGQAFSDLFRGRNRSNSINSQATSAYPGPISTAAAQAQAHQRHFSINATGLSGTSPTAASPLGLDTARRGSGSSFTSTTVDENAVDDAEGPASPSSPFARRLSFGARALRDVQSGGTVNNGTKSALPPARPRGSRGGGEGFKWSESLRSRAERASIAAAQSVAGSQPAAGQHQRAQSATAAPITSQQPPPKSPKVPDHFQERILKGDFYMD